jgi:hypothetical protein
MQPYELPPASYENRRVSQLLDWEMRTGRSKHSFMTPGEDHVQTLLLEAENERLYRRLPHGASWSEGLRAQAQAWLDEARCRWHGLGFGQPCPEAAG